VPEVRRWQTEVLGRDFMKALGSGVPDESPYKSS
jgi:hypothetical protein